MSVLRSCPSILSGDLLYDLAYGRNFSDALRFSAVGVGDLCLRNGLLTGERDLDREGDITLVEPTNLPPDLDLLPDPLEDRLHDLGKSFSPDCDVR